MNIRNDRYSAPDNRLDPTFSPLMPYEPAARKRKWLTGVLSMVVPGLGHFYLGLMQRGLFFMLLVVLDIFMITFLANQQNTSAPAVTLFSLCLPVVYFYSLFDALQLTDRLNRYAELLQMAGTAWEGEYPASLQRMMKGTNLGILLIVTGCLVFLVSKKPDWFSFLYNMMGSLIGSCVLILAGLAMFVLDTRKNK
ncbi:DUF6677 family protein [Paenibacillus whitsoniae]|uniref:TM2 domain-containing protein n=1 Tax=Paenibacillus whitsoniae TaxID=2496558 RepID=A0A3S0AND9_9BACL|nr:DUF6677 family protein [Paenibacillus whitsoniae]RTE08410.1 hypothetical protein EJQ19_17480 [Paenibacillus whitsoniae]